MGSVKNDCSMKEYSSPYSFYDSIISSQKKSGLILLDVLVTHRCEHLFFQPQPVHGTPDCSAQIAAVLAGTGGLLSF